MKEIIDLTNIIKTEQELVQNSPNSPINVDDMPMKKSQS